MKLASANIPDKRSRPLVAALEVLDREGPDGLTLRAVAAAGGFTNPAIYRHYGSKEALLLDVIRVTYAEFVEAVASVAQVEPPERRLRAILGRVRDWAADHNHQFDLLFLNPHRVRLDRYPEDIESERSAAVGLLRSTVKACMDDGALRADDPTRVTLHLVAQVNGVVGLLLSGRLPTVDVYREFFDASMDLVLRGLTP